jgi:shikimate kinase
MVEEINVLRKANESLGGVFEVLAFGVVPGLGSHVSWEERLDGLIGSAMLSIQAVKGCGIGDGFDLAGRPGSAAHDEIFYSAERGYFRETNRSGGIEGGMTTGEPVLVRCAMKPLPTLTKPLRSVDIATRSPRRRCASAPTPARCPPPAWWGRPCWRSCWRPRAARSSAGITSTTHGPPWPLRGAHRLEAAIAVSALVFIGFMGAGKTSAARAAAAELGGRAVDSDQVIEERIGTSIEDYFSSHGERAFREAEEEAIADLLENPPGPVLSLGGGAIASDRVRRLLPDHTVVLLDVDEDTAWRRAGGGARSRATAPASAPCWPSAPRSTRGSPTRCCWTPRATWCAAPCRRSAGSRTRRPARG